MTDRTHNFSIRRATGFTLIEMLVVIAVIAVLASILIPVIGSVRSKAKEAKCASNLRQIGAANLAFTNDHNGKIAAGTTWGSYWYLFQIRPYLEGSSELDNFIEVMVCPADETEGWGDPQANHQAVRRSYGVNEFLNDDDDATRGKRLVEIPFPAKTVYAGDTGLGPTQSAWVNGRDPWLSATKERHGGRINYVFLDGHVEGFEAETLYPGKENHNIFTGE